MPWKIIRYLVSGAAWIGLIVVGVNYAALPDYEVCFKAEKTSEYCSADGCLGAVSIYIGNSGTKAQKNIELLFSRSALQDAALPLRFRNFGKILRRVKTYGKDDVYHIILGDMPPKQEVEGRVVFMLEAGKPPPLLSEVFLGTKGIEGEMHECHAAGRRFLRILYRMFTI